MQKSPFTKTVITAGFAMFAMFFGSGNLVFPLDIGTKALDQSLFAILGLTISGVFVPFLGLIGVVLYAGNRAQFLSCIGKVPAFLLTFAMLAVMGPIGVIPRCIIVAHGGVALFMPKLSLPVFSVLFLLVTMLLVWNHDRIVPIIGRILTPWLLGGIIVLVAVGFYFGPPAGQSAATSSEILKLAFNEGYQTMDLLAAFFFSATTVAYIHRHLMSTDSFGELAKLSVTSSFIGAGLLGLVYISFILLGAKYAPQLVNVKQEQMFAAISGFALGPLAIPVASITIALACLTTATVLVMLFSDFLHEELTMNRIGEHPSVIITVVISFFVSLVGFDSLKIWIGTILEVAYPALIALTIANIINRLWNVSLGKWAFWLTLLVCVIIYAKPRFFSLMYMAFA